MLWKNPSDEKLRAVLVGASTVAVVGCSSDPSHPSNRVTQMLQRLGFRVIPISETETSVLGMRAYRRLSDVPEQVDIVDVLSPPEQWMQIAEQSKVIGARGLWLEQGLNPDAALLAERTGVTCVMGNSLTADLERVAAAV